MSQLAKDFFKKKNYYWISTKCLRVSHLRVRNKLKILTVAVLDLWRVKRNYLGSKKIDLNYFMSLPLLPI